MLEPGKRPASTPDTGEARAESTVEELFSLADLEQAATNYESAIRTFRKVLDRKDLEDADQGRALLGIGGSLERIGRWKEAMNVLEDALVAARKASDNGLVARCLIEQGKIQLGQGHVDAALDCAREARDRADAKKQPSIYGFALNLLGTSHNRRGDLEKSASCFHEALSAFKGAGDIRSLSLAYNNLGLVYKQKREWQRALEYLQVASSLQAIEGDYPERRAGMHNLGLVHLRMGQWEKARECFSVSLEISREVNDPLGIIRGLLATASIDLTQRRWTHALATLEQCLELCSEELYPQETALTYRSLGQLHQARGEFTRARRCLEVAWRKAVEISEHDELARELLRLRADLAFAEGKIADAGNLARRAVDASSRQADRLEIALAQVSLARVLLAEGDSEGYALFDQAEAALRPMGSPLPLVKVLIEEGETRLREKADLPRAETLLSEARDLLAGLDLPQMEVETLVAMARVSTARGELHAAGEHLERARSLAGRLEDPETVATLSRVQRELEDRLVETSVANLGAFRTAGRLEEVIDSNRPYATKLGDVLEIMAQAVEADGAAMIMNGDNFPGATYRIGSSVQSLLSRVLRRHRPERPEIVLDTVSNTREPWREAAEARKASSLMVIPIYGNGTTAYLYLDRLVEENGAAFGPSHLNICLALVPQLESVVDRVSLEGVLDRQEDTLHRRTFLADVVTQNPEMIEILKLVEKINRTELTVLLQGETGTGKTLIARAIHLSSDRAKSPFVTVDCAALPENLLESELFGYTKGAFTGASQDKKGLFEEADGGTIFLDEIGRAGLGVQRRLLHLLDRGEVRPVGANTYRKLNVRVICATSAKDLLAGQEHGPFIKDLYYRLNDIIIRVPALRERLEDIPLLAEYFLETFNSQTGRSSPGFSRSVMQRMVRYAWPGNVRELEKAVRRAAILADEGATIGNDLMPQEILDATESVSGTVSAGKDADLRATVEDMERRMVLDALRKHGWNKTRASQELGLSRKGLKNKIARYGLKPEAN